MIYTWIRLLVLLAALLPVSVEAQAPMAKMHGILMNAQSMFGDYEKETSELEGNVQIVFNGQHIRADKARVFSRSRQVELYGNVEVMDAKNTIVGDRMFLDYENNTGIIYNGYVQSGSVTFSGDILQKTGDAEYLVSGADYTACTNCPASWSFSGTNIRAELGGYAYIKNAILKVGAVPIFWMPYLIVPLKSDRQSGLLTPEFEFSEDGGFTWGIPYFWAISEDSDATIGFKDYARRGPKGLFEYRYALTENSFGQLNAASIYDRAFADDPRLNRYRPASEQNKPMDRWFVRYEHYQELTDGGVHRAQVNLASDLQYAKDFPLETNNYGDSAMENRVSYTKNTQDQHYSVDSSYYVNMLHADPLAGNEDAVHRLPELRFSQAQKSIGNSNFIYTIDVDLVNFARSGGAYDDLIQVQDANGVTYRVPSNYCTSVNGPKVDWENDPTCRRTYEGVYDPSTDLIRTGQRLDVSPTLYYPINFIDGVEIMPKVAYRETYYNFNIDNQAALTRRYLSAELAARFKFSRTYGDDINPKATRFKHEVVPEVSYSRLPYLSQDNHPFFGQSTTALPYRAGLTDLDIGSDYGVQFDYNDRVYDRNLVTVALVNKLAEKRWVSERPQYQQVAYLRLAQSYDATQDGRYGRNEPWSDLSAILDVRYDWLQAYSTFNYYPYQGVTNSSASFRFTNSMGQFAQLQLTQRFQISPGQPVNPSNRQEDYTFGTGFISRYVNLMGKVVYNLNWENSKSQEKIKSWAYITQFKPPGDCIMITFIHYQNTDTFANYSLNFAFNFDGVAKPALPPATLDSYGF